MRIAVRRLRSVARRRITSVRGPRRKTTWGGVADQSYVAVGANASVIVSSFQPFASGIINPTVIRKRGMISIVPNVTTADIEIVGAYGVGVVTADAFAAGAGSIPGPWTDSDWDGWFVWRSFSMSFEFQDATGVMLDGLQFEVDSKAMRKIESDDVIVSMCESQAAAFRISAPIRTLLLLS